MAAACAQRGVDFLDAPVTGGTWGAEKGELVFMVGGDAKVLDRAKPVLEAMGKKFFLLGPNAAGQTVKLGMNLLLALKVDALAESLALVTKAGVAAERLIEVMQSSMGHAPLLDVKAPLILKNEYPASFPLRLMHKDLRLALELARKWRQAAGRRSRLRHHVGRERSLQGRSRFRGPRPFLEIVIQETSPKSVPCTVRRTTFTARKPANSLSNPAP